MVNRQQLGQVIAQTFRGVRRINQSRYFIKSQSGNGKYEVHKNELGWVCSCADHEYRGVRCKHIYAVEFSFAIRETVKQTQELVIQPISQLACRYCNSEHIVKKAIGRNK
jgi:putative transposase